MHIAVVTMRRTAARARMTVRSLGSTAGACEVHVLDLDGSYRPLRGEEVLRPADVGLDAGQLHALAAWCLPRDLVAVAGARLVAALGARSHGVCAVVVASPGTLFCSAPELLASQADERGLVLLARTAPATADARRPDLRDLAEHGSYLPGLFAVRTDRSDVLALWEGCALQPDGTADRWLDLAAALLPNTVVRDPAQLASAWTLSAAHVVTTGNASCPDGRTDLLLDGSQLVAVDLVHLDPLAPWLLDPSMPGDPRARLSDHPVLASVVLAAAAELEAEDDDTSAPDDQTLERSALGTPLDPALRLLYRGAGTAAADQEPPDLFDPAQKESLLSWLTSPSPQGAPSRYLLAVRAVRPDLQAAFPHVPGRHDADFARWATDHAAADGFSDVLTAESVRRATAPTHGQARPTPGVNVVGFLHGELGIGESARLLVGSLEAARVPHTSIPVETHLSSRQRAVAPDDDRAQAGTFDTTVLCVNADLTPAVTGALPESLDGTYRIGMWYWEVEDFPATQRASLGLVDEVWVATDFIRDAIEPHASVPVRTITPPLPQRRGAAPAHTRGHLGLPDRPLFLFAFDYLSTAERKNPLGLIEAFTSAFAPDDGPVLVLKSINASLRPAEAERVRLRAEGLAHVILLEEYLDAAERDSLMAACDCYVSLHRSEGLGLTMAEAMAWGKPVIATGYSGNLQFMTESNSFLVRWAPVAIPAGADPYPAGATWAEPDLQHAAALMRHVLEQPQDASSKGARAAADISSLHSPAAAGERLVARLAEIREIVDERRSTAHRGLVRTTAQRLRRPRG